MADTASPNGNQSHGRTGRGPVSPAYRAQLLSGIRQGVRLRTTAEKTRGTADEGLSHGLQAARNLGIPVAEIARNSGLSPEDIYALTGELPPFEPRRSHA